MSFLKNLFKGRLSRRQFGVSFLLMVVSVGVVSSIVLASIPKSTDHRIVVTALCILILAELVLGISVFSRRFHDLNKSGWWGLLYILPSLNFIVFLFLLFIPSENENNRFGVLPSKEIPFLNVMFGLVSSKK